MALNPLCLSRWTWLSALQPTCGFGLCEGCGAASCAPPPPALVSDATQGNCVKSAASLAGASEEGVGFVRIDVSCKAGWVRLQVYAGPLEDGARAAVLFNRHTAGTQYPISNVTVRWEDIGGTQRQVRLSCGGLVDIAPHMPRPPPLCRAQRGCLPDMVTGCRAGMVLVRQDHPFSGTMHAIWTVRGSTGLTGHALPLCRPWGR